MRREDLTKAQRWAIADRLAQERLPIVNATQSPALPRDGFYVRYGKRVADIALASMALVVSAPLNAALAIGTFLDVGKPILFKQERIGKDGKSFTIIKFRNMRDTTDERGELLPASQRVTRFGAFVRKYSLDEFLNFWHVFKGDMSIIGPRPLLPEYTGRYSNRHKARLAVRPGLECPPRSPLNHVWTWQDQLENDVWYVENVSLATDLMMCVNLVKFAFDSKSAEARSQVKGRGIFMGYDLDGVAINLSQVPQRYIDEVSDE